MTRPKSHRDDKAEKEVILNSDDKKRALRIIQRKTPELPDVTLQVYACKARLPEVAMAALDRLASRYPDKPSLKKHLDTVIHNSIHPDVSKKARNFQETPQKTNGKQMPG